MNRRVVVTGLGVVSPVGTGTQKFWEALLAGVNGCEDIKSFDTSRYRTHKGGEVKDFEPEKYLSKDVSKMTPTTQFALAATEMALDDSRIDLESVSAEKIGVCVGSNTLDPLLGQKYIFFWEENGYLKTTKELARDATMNHAFKIASEFGFKGPNFFIPTACAAGNYTIGYAYDLIKQNKADVMVAGGVDPMNQLGFAGFNRLYALAPDKCQPFDKNRKGLMMSEGCGLLMLEDLAQAKKRGAKIYAEILGYGLGCDAYHMTTPHPEGKGVAKAIEMALSSAGVKREDIDYINAHGTATTANDKMETKAIKAVFGKRTKSIPVSSIKSMIGHMMGAASAAEAAATCLTVQNDAIPPTINYEEPDPECDLDCVPNQARQQRVDIALSNSFAFGGNIGILVIGKYHE